jgi:hypothetical protein
MQSRTRAKNGRSPEPVSVRASALSAVAEVDKFERAEPG